MMPNVNSALPVDVQCADSTAEKALYIVVKPKCSFVNIGHFVVKVFINRGVNSGPGALAP